MASLDSLLHRRPPSAWDRFCSSPLIFLAQAIYRWSKPPAGTTPPDSDLNPERIRLVCISDTHNTHWAQPALPAGDILIHAGDLTHSGTINEIEDSFEWLNGQTYAHKVVIGGNHDRALADLDDGHRSGFLRKYSSLMYLQNSSVELSVRGRVLRIYGSPYTPKHGSWVFQYPRVRRVPPSAPIGDEARSADAGGPQSDGLRVWRAIPPATDILITHGPPLGHLDLMYGCVALLDALWRVRPLVHVFGHIHGGRGVRRLNWDSAQSAYEDVCTGRSGWWGLIRLVWWAVLGKLSERLGECPATVLVNASAVGGVRDDERRGAIVVDI